MVDRGEMGKGRACRGLVSGEIVRGGWRSGKGVCIAEVPSNRLIEKHLTLLDASSKSFTGRFVGSRELSPRDRDERRRNMMESRGMPDASPIENTSATTLFLPFTLSPSWAYKCVLRVTRRKEGNRRNEIVPCTRNRPSRSANPPARLSRRRVLNIQNFLRGRNFCILLGECVPAGRRVWLRFLHDLWFAAAVRRGDFPAEDSPIFQGIRNPWRNNATNVPFVKATVLAWK